MNESPSAMEVRMNHAEDRLEKHEKAIDRIGQRPPVWVTPVIGALMAVCGWFAHMVIS